MSSSAVAETADFKDVEVEKATIDPGSPGYKILVEDRKTLFNLPDKSTIRPLQEEGKPDGIEVGKLVWVVNPTDKDFRPCLGRVTRIVTDEYRVEFLHNTERFSYSMVDVTSGTEAFTDTKNKGYQLYTDDYLQRYDHQPDSIKGGTTNPTQMYVYKTKDTALDLTLVNVEKRSGNIFTIADEMAPSWATGYDYSTSTGSNSWGAVQALPKDLVEHYVEQYSGETLTGEKAVRTISVDPTTKTAVDALLSSAGTDIETLLKAHNEGGKEVLEAQLDAKTQTALNAKLQEELHKMRSEVAKGTFTPPDIEYTPPTAAGKTQDLPEGRVEWKPAKDVFKVPPKFHKQFNFDVPIWFWFKKNDDGTETEVEHPLVPKGSGDYIFKPNVLPLFLWGFVKNKKMWLAGHTGTGKSSLVEEVCAVLKYPLIRINFDSEITRMDLIGRDVLSQEDGATTSTFIDGVLPQALSQPCCLLCDEMDFVRPEISYVMQRALEDKGLLVTEDGGRLIAPHPMFRLVATANTQGQGDEYGYQGARTQSMAFLDRFTVWLDIEYLKANEEAALIKSRVKDITDDHLEQVIKYVKEHRAAFTNAEITQALSPRGVLSLCEAIVTFTGIMPTPSEGLQLALEGTILNRANPQDRNVLQGIIDRVFDIK